MNSANVMWCDERGNITTLESDEIERDGEKKERKEKGKANEALKIILNNKFANTLAHSLHS